MSIMGLVPQSPTFNRRALLMSVPVSISGSTLTAMATPEAQFSHSLSTIDIEGYRWRYGVGRAIPVAIWRPAATDTVVATTYPYKIDIGKIAAKLRVGWLSWLPKFDYNLPCGNERATELSGFPSALKGDAIIFAHGFLGSVYDFAHAAEALAADGFVVVAPELPESLSASYIPPEGLSREEIIAAARQHADCPGRWGIFGHSAGAGSALTQRGEFALGRACFAGGAARMASYASADPLFVCSSNGDGCNRFMGAGSEVDLRPLISSTPGTKMFGSLGEAYSDPKCAPPGRGAFVFAADNSPLPLPCHISFLWSEVDDAMGSLLSPLLPLAKVLGLFLLDFDVYLENKDAEKTAAALVPALRRFFLAASKNT